MTNIEIRKVQFVNKGAELMLHAILQAVSVRYPDAKFVMEPNFKSSPYDKRAKLGLYQKALPGKIGSTLPYLGYMVPYKLRAMYGILLDHEIDIVLDSAGFAYSSQWGVEKTKRLAYASRRWKKRGTKLILLPQAFGPFNSEMIKKYIFEIVNNADLVFVRDAISYQNLVNAVGERNNIKTAPDFTNLVQGVLPKNFDNSQNRFAITPNYRMIDKTSQNESQEYIPFLVNCVNHLIQRNAKPFLLIHEGEDDLNIANQIVRNSSEEIPVIQEVDPIKVKGILGACDGVIGSRFHSLVSSLSQGIPALGTSWSHKYKALFQDYDFEDGLVNLKNGEAEKMIENLTQPNLRDKISKRLKLKSEEMKSQTEKMWLTIFEYLEN